MNTYSSSTWQEWLCIAPLVQLLNTAAQLGQISCWCTCKDTVIYAPPLSIQEIFQHLSSFGSWWRYLLIVVTRHLDSRDKTPNFISVEFYTAPDTVFLGDSNSEFERSHSDISHGIMGDRYVSGWRRDCQEALMPWPAWMIIVYSNKFHGLWGCSKPTVA